MSDIFSSARSVGNDDEFANLPTLYTKSFDFCYLIDCTIISVLYRFISIKSCPSLKLHDIANSF